MKGARGKQILANAKPVPNYITDHRYDDHHRDGGHPWDRLEDFDHFDEGSLPKGRFQKKITRRTTTSERKKFLQVIASFR